MTRPDLLFRHARASALLAAVFIAATSFAAVTSTHDVALRPFRTVAMSDRTMSHRAEYHPYYARKLGHRMARDFGWHSNRQWRCLKNLWSMESAWHVHADNPSNSAYGIPQALPGSKMSSAGGHWRSNATTQIRWGIHYVRNRYRAPCGAWRHKRWHGWY